MSVRAEGERIARLLGLECLPGEGGLFRRTYVDARCSVIYFMLLAPDFSALHALDGVETYLWQGSSPLGEWTLAGTTMAPAFDWSAFRLGRRAELLAGWPHAAPRIRALTRT